jgi:hypothetical protein
MTKNGLMQLGLKEDNAAAIELETQMNKLSDNITKAPTNYRIAKVQSEEAITQLRDQMRVFHSSVESPVECVKTQIKPMPLAADSMSMDVQYFLMDQMKQDAEVFAQAIVKFVTAATSWLGSSVASQATSTATKQAQEQAIKHSISGTLVISVTCTHKPSMAPCVLLVHPL